MKNIKKLFKEKTSIKKELADALKNNTLVSFSILSKSVGISLYRVKKYCKNHYIDLNNYNQNTLNKKSVTKIKEEKAQELVKKAKQKKKIKVGVPTNIKIKLKKPINIKLNID